MLRCGKHDAGLTTMTTHPLDQPTTPHFTHSFLPHTLDVAAALLVAPVIAALDSHDGCDDNNELVEKMRKRGVSAV